MTTKKTFISAISGIEFLEKEKVVGNEIRIPILNLIKLEYPDFIDSQAISESELNLFREKYISKFLENEVDEIADLRNRLLKAVKSNKSFVSRLEKSKDDRTLGQQLADHVASFGGSWTFIISFLIFIAIWIGINVFIYVKNEFDPYPFILLNLILSCIAALQAPIIMMSQNRQEEKDRERAKKDYMINLKSELEIRMLDEKIDHLIMHQQQELIEIQKVQIEMMNDILERIKK
jgi:uncharacterized membrane protein